MEAINDRRIRILLIDGAAMMAMFKEGLKVRQDYKIIKGVPSDAQLMGVSIDHATGCPVMVVWSSEFENIPEGKQFPRIQVQIRTG